MREAMTKTLVVLMVISGALSLTSPASADQTTHHDEPITAQMWVNTEKTFPTKADCDTYGAGGVALGQWSAWDCRYYWFFFPNRWMLWVKTG